MSGAAGTTYLLDIEVETDKATGQLVNFRKTANAEVGAAGREMGAALTSAEATTAKAAVGMTDSLGKLRPLMGTITRGLGAMGVEGAGAFSGLTRGAITLLNTGFTPLGLAVAGVTAAIGVFARSSSDAAEKISPLVAQMKEMSDAAHRTWAEFDKLQKMRADSAVGSGSGAEQLVNRLEQEVAAQRLRAERLTAGGDHPAEWRTLEVLQEQLRQARFALSQQNSEAITADVLANLEAGRTGFQTWNKPHDRLQMSDPYAGFKPSPGLVADETTREVAALAAAERQRRAEENAGILSDFEANRAAEAATRASRDEVIQANAERQAAAFAEAQKEAMRMAARDAETFRGFGEQGAASITSALNRSIQSGDFRSFFAQFQSGMQEAVISAFTYALIQKPLANALGDVTQGIGGLFGYGKGAGTGTSVAQSGTMETFMANGGGGAPKSVRMNFSDGTEIHINNKKAGGGMPRGKAARWAS